MEFLTFLVEGRWPKQPKQKNFPVPAHILTRRVNLGEKVIYIWTVKGQQRAVLNGKQTHHAFPSLVDHAVHPSGGWMVHDPKPLDISATRPIWGWEKAGWVGTEATGKEVGGTASPVWRPCTPTEGALATGKGWWFARLVLVGPGGSSEVHVLSVMRFERPLPRF